MQCHTAVEQGDHTLNLQTNTLLAASKKSKVRQKVIKSSSKVHQKFIKISQITISGSKISKVHQKFIKSSKKMKRSSCKITFAGDSFQLRTPLLLHYQSQHARICACARACIRKRTCINVCIWTEKVCNSSTLLKRKVPVAVPDKCICFSSCRLWKCKSSLIKMHVNRKYVQQFFNLEGNFC